MDTTTAYNKIIKLKKKYRIVQGGQGAGKTYSILQLLFLAAYEHQYRIAVITDTYPNLKDGVIEDMKAIVTGEGLDWSSHYNIQDKNLTINKSVISFRNLDSGDIHNKKGVRYDAIYINEGNRMGYKALEQMMTRAKIAVYIDYNPDEEFWAHTELATREDADLLILTYKDNELLSDAERLEIEHRIKESEKPGASDSLKEWVRVYAHGLVGTYSERRIYDYKITKEIPITARKIFSGMDFGHSPDKTALVDLYIDGSNLYLDERFSLNNLRQEKIQGDLRQSIVDQMELINFPKGQMIVADSSGAIAINDLKKHGYSVFAVKKRPGDQKIFINKLRGFTWHITERSLNIKKDIESFYWKVDKNGKIIPEPDGHEPDTLVSIRYAIMAARV